MLTEEQIAAIPDPSTRAAVLALSIAHTAQEQRLAKLESRVETLGNELGVPDEDTNTRVEKDKIVSVNEVNVFSTSRGVEGWRKRRRHDQDSTGEEEPEHHETGTGEVSQQNSKKALPPHDGDKNYVCEYGCGYSTSVYRRLWNHMNTHTNERPFACKEPGCSARFNDESHLSRHKRIHTGEKPHACTFPGCNSRFREKKSLTYHLGTHEGEKRAKPHICPYKECQAAFAGKGTLRNHVRVHTGDYRHKCTFSGCVAKFRDKAALDCHLRAHTGERPFECTFPGCLARYKEKRYLRDHIVRANHEQGSLE